jgi:hypothetical protein
MALHSLRSGYATLEYEIAQERASALGRLGRGDLRLRAGGTCPMPADGHFRTINPR